MLRPFGSLPRPWQCRLLNPHLWLVPACLSPQHRGKKWKAKHWGPSEHEQQVGHRSTTQNKAYRLLAWLLQSRSPAAALVARQWRTRNTKLPSLLSWVVFSQWAVASASKPLYIAEPIWATWEAESKESWQQGAQTLTIYWLYECSSRQANRGMPLDSKKAVNACWRIWNWAISLLSLCRRSTLPWGLQLF